MSEQRRKRGAVCNRSVRLNAERCVGERRRLGFTRESLSERAAGSRPLSVATIKRAEQGLPIYVGSAARLAELLGSSLTALALDSEDLCTATNATDFPRLRVHRFQRLRTETGLEPAAEALSLGLTDDLVRRLSARCFPVISLLVAPGEGASAQESKASYDVEGAVIQAGNVLRVNARLTGASGRVLWADSFQRPVGDIFALQDELTRVIASHIGKKLLDVEVTERATMRPSELLAWEHSLAGRWHFKKYDRVANERARRHMLEALRSDHSLPIAWYTLALTHQRDLLNQWTAQPAASLEQLVQVSEQFDRELPDDALSHVVAAYRHVYTGNRNRAAARLREAIDVDPNIPLAYCLLGQTMAMAGDWEPAIEQLEAALSLAEDPDERMPSYVSLALAYFVGGQYRESVAWAERGAAARGAAAFAYFTIASASAWLGDEAAAREAFHKVESFGTNVVYASLLPLLKTTEPEIANRYMDGLKRAGLHV